LLGSFGPMTLSVPRARLAEADGATREWRSAALPRYARMTQQAEALIASAYLAGTNKLRWQHPNASCREGARQPPLDGSLLQACSGGRRRRSSSQAATTSAITITTAMIAPAVLGSA
jgi:hypothetical protein